MLDDSEDIDDSAADTEGEAWEVAKTVGTDEEAALAAGFLNSNGIPAQVESLHASEFPTDFGHLGEVHIMVPADRLQEAQLLLAQSENAVADDADAEPDSVPADTGGRDSR
ncbi:MAG TPA: hypothetical protein VFJ65_12250 [Solirubrobacterales bacterium]|nr:hypothetical protein [Solirubrobacterales bacterium]